MAPMTKLAILLAPLLPLGARGTLYEFPNTLYNGSVTMEVTSQSTGLNHPKIFPYPNATSSSAWFFDVVSSSSDEHVVMIPYLGGPEGLPGAPAPLPILFSLSGTFANGTEFQIPILADPNDTVTVQTTRYGSSGDWKSAGVRWENPDPDTYIVYLDKPSQRLSGTVTFKSIAPAHLFCSRAQPKANELSIGHIAWENAIPDANAVVDITIGDEKLRFTGFGYQDLTWSSMPVVDIAQYWYWGQTRLGPFSLVWYDSVARDGTKYVSSYVFDSKNIISASCHDGAVKARPFGGNSTYPPQETLTNPDGFTVQFDLGSYGFLELNATITQVLGNSPAYARYIATTSGGLRGGPRYKGKALLDQLRLNA